MHAFSVENTSQPETKTSPFPTESWIVLFDHLLTLRLNHLGLWAHRRFVHTRSQEPTFKG